MRTADSVDGADQAAAADAPLHEPVPHLTPQQRMALGRQARRDTPRSSHAEYAPAAGRPDPIDLLEHQARMRVSELVPIRYGRMADSPFAFFRGAALVMACDLAATPRTGLTVQVCGDAHLSNFGLYASPERRLMFDINDFDETLPGPWEWDVKRLATSVLIAARDGGLSDRNQERAVLACAAEYRRRMAQFAAMPNLDVWYSRFEVEELVHALAAQVGRRMRKRLEKHVARATARDNTQAYLKLTREIGGRRRIASQPPLIVPAREFLLPSPLAALESRVGHFFDLYAGTLPHDRRMLLEQFHVVDIARKVVGVGSVGTHAWVVLLLGRDGHDPLVMQVKEAQASVLERLLGPSEYANAGERVVAGQRMMQAVSDIFLGWLHVDVGIDGAPRDYYVRQLRDWKGSISVDGMTPRALNAYGALCAACLARAHARSGDRIAISAYLGGGESFDRAVLGFSHAYADQNSRDHRALVDAIASGRIRADEAP